MKTCTYQDVLYQAAENAQRTRDKIPVSEAPIILNHAHSELRTMWQCQAWPELCDNLGAGVAVVNTNGVLTFSTNEGTANEIGDVLAILTADPRATKCVKRLNFHRGNRQVYLEAMQCGMASTVFVDYQLAPVNLLAINANPTTAIATLGHTGSPSTLLNTNLPERFLQPLAMSVASLLWQMDGNTGQMGVWRGLAQSNLDWQAAQPEMTAPWWRGIQMR